MTASQTESGWDQVLVDIKEYVFHYKIESAKAWRTSRTALLDSLACAVESIHTSAECRSLLGPVVPGTVTPDGFKLPGTSYQLDPVKGAFDFGIAIRYLDHNDSLGGADWGHPSDNLGALLSVMDWLCRSVRSGRIVHSGPPLSTKTLLEAMIKAYEIQGSFLIRNPFNAHGLDHVVLVKLASAAVVSWLLGLSEVQTMAAMSHVWMDGAALRIYRSGSNTIPRKGWAAGDACMRAVSLALLVRAGQLGSKTVLTMPRWGFYCNLWSGGQFDLSRGFGTWAMENIFFKVMPVEGHSISAIEATLIQYARLSNLGNISESQIAKVEVRTNGAANMIINKSGPLHNGADRDHCMQYSVAVALLKGDVPAAEDYQDSSPWASSSVVESLRARIIVREDEQLTEDYLNINKKSVSSGVTLHLADGHILDEVLVEYPVGHLKHPQTLESVGRKFGSSMALMFTKEETSRIVKVVESGDDTPIADFVDLLTRNEEVRPKM